MVGITRSKVIKNDMGNVNKHVNLREVDASELLGYRIYTWIYLVEFIKFSKKKHTKNLSGAKLRDVGPET